MVDTSLDAGVVVTCAQIGLAVGDAGGNRRAASRAIESAVAAGADVVVLPELVNSGYALRDAAELAALAEGLDGPTVTAWSDAARRDDIVIVGGLAERDDDGRIRNSAVVVDSGGVRGVYRKAHLWGEESMFFVAGDALPPVVDTRVGRIGVLVCYDVEFPEWVRSVALQGAELLCVPTNWPYSPSPVGERHILNVRVQAAAATERVYIAVCDRTGSERGVEWVGGSMISDHRGYPMAGPASPGETLLVARCRLTDARDKRVGPRNDAFADRRVSLYGGILAPQRRPPTPTSPRPRT